ncbi:MAG TPA: hypothetical protein GXZ46_09700 [Actinomycetales bacterium]|nr:hypothetical protein [Actinomycetales bacterium]
MSSKTTPTDGYGPDGIDGARVGRQMGLISMVLGMGGLITSAFLIGIPIGAVAVVLGLTAIIKSIGAHRRIEKAGRQPRTGGAFGLGLIGVITGSLGIAIGMAIYVTAQNAHERCEHHEYNTPAYNECITNELGN